MNISLRDLLQAGVHFGHPSRSWNPKMRPYIYGSKNGIHIIDLQKTARGLLSATRFISSTVGQGGQVLFVGTKRAAADIISEEAKRSNMFFVNHRWLGGTMTNWQTVKKSIDRLLQLESMRDDGRFEMLTKKEALMLSREITKMDRSLGGIKHMKGLPAVLFVVDPRKEQIAVKEARVLGIPVVALCDTNCDPDGLEYVVPGNDDALKSIRLFTAAVADAIINGRQTATGKHAKAHVAADEQLNVQVVARSASGEGEATASPAVETAVETEVQA